MSEHKKLIKNENQYLYDFLPKNLQYTRDSLKSLIKMALPIYGYVILMVIYGQIDTLFLGIFNDEKAVALYSSAIRLSNPFMIFASAITLTFFPLIVKKIKNNEDIVKFVSTILTVLFLFSSTIALFVFFHSKDIIEIVFGEKYLLAEIPLKFLSISIIFLFVNFFMVDLLTALNKQKLNFIYGILLNIISIPLYIFILPKFSYLGASIIKLCAIALGSIFLFSILYKKVTLKIQYVNIFLWLCLNITFFYLLNNLSFYFALVPEGLFIILSLLFLNVLRYDELFTILSAINMEKHLSKIKFLVKS